MVKLIWMSIVPAPQAGAKGKEVATLVAEQDLGNHWWFWAQWQGTNTAEGTDEFQTEAGKFSCDQQDAKTIPGDKSNAFLPEQNGSGMKEHVTTAISFTNTASNSRTSGCLCVVLLWPCLNNSEIACIYLYRHLLYSRPDAFCEYLLTIFYFINNQ